MSALAKQALGNQAVPNNARRSQKLELANLSVLIIDDQPFFRSLLTEVLRALGISQIFAAVDGVTGLAAFDEHRPDIVITDWIMPQVDGLEFTRRVRRHREEARRFVPIILVTANSDRNTIELARSHGVDEFLLKPISAKAILDRLSEVIEKPRSFVATPTYMGPCRRRFSKPGFRGPYRRLNDPIEVDDGVDSVQVSLLSVMKQALDHVGKLAQGLGSGAPNVRPLHQAVSEIQSIADDLGDQDIELACEQFLAYIVIMNTTRKVVPAMVQAYIQVLESLVELDRTQTKERAAALDSLARFTKQSRAA
jgi:two-component system, chemotaxis family, chemotaxis protein CheY